MGTSYNLIDEPWIPIVENGGARRDVGIEETLCRAHEIVEMRDASPLVTVALHRLLVVIAHRAHEGPMDLDHWGAMWKKGRFDEGKVRSYLKEVHGLFDLFDEEKPFYQTASVRNTNAVDVANLLIDKSRGTNINHFSHDYDGSSRICPSCCARGLVRLPAFCTKTGGGPAGWKYGSINNPSARGEASPVYCLVSGSSLFQTLMVNVPIPGIASPKATDDAPVWEGQSRHDSRCVGFMEGLTWQPRRALLVPELAGDDPCANCGAHTRALVSRVVLGKGREYRDEDERKWRDPHVPAMRSDDGLQSLRPPHPFKALWGHPAVWRTVYRASLVDLDQEVGVPALRQLLSFVAKDVLHRDFMCSILFAALHASEDKLMRTNQWRWHFPVGWLADDRRRAGSRRILDLAGALSEEVKRTGTQQIAKRSKRKDIARRGVIAFERAAEGIFRNHVENPDLASAEDAARRMSEAAERAFDMALPSQGAYSTRRGKRNRSDLAGRMKLAVCKATEKGGGPQQAEGVRRFVRALRKMPVLDLQRLRRATGRSRGHDVHVNDMFNDMWRPLRDRFPGVPRSPLHLVATLYPWNLRRPKAESRPPAEMGAGFRQALAGSQERDRRRLEGRFLRLLDSRGTDLGAALLDAVRFMERGGVPVAWEQLALDLADWERPGRPVQERWYGSFKRG